MTRRIAFTAPALLLASLIAVQASAQTSPTPAPAPTVPSTPAPDALPQTPPAPAPPADSTAVPTAPPALLVNGTTAPDFTVQDRLGHPVKLSDYKGKTVVIDFWATWCGPCQESLPHTNALARKYRGQNVVFLAINTSDSLANFQAWLPKHADDDALKFVIDAAPGDQSIANAKYNVSGIPTQYVISPQGKIAASMVGFDPTNPSESDLQKAIAAAKAS